MKNNTKLEGEGSWGGIWEGVGEYDHNSLYNIVKKTNKIFRLFKDLNNSKINKKFKDSFQSCQCLKEFIADIELPRKGMLSLLKTLHASQKRLKRTQVEFPLRQANTSSLFSSIIVVFKKWEINTELSKQSGILVDSRELITLQLLWYSWNKLLSSHNN